jgi:hypothetical protein
VAVLARLQGGSIHNLTTEYSSVFPDPKGIPFIIYSIFVSIYRENKGKKKKSTEVAQTVGL